MEGVMDRPPWPYEFPNRGERPADGSPTAPEIAETSAARKGTQREAVRGVGASWLMLLSIAANRPSGREMHAEAASPPSQITDRTAIARSSSTQTGSPCILVTKTEQARNQRRERVSVSARSPGTLKPVLGLQNESLCHRSTPKRRVPRMMEATCATPCHSGVTKGHVLPCLVSPGSLHGMIYASGLSPVERVQMWRPFNGEPSTGQTVFQGSIQGIQGAPGLVVGCMWDYWPGCDSCNL
ncbi:hypothetical protein BCR34DRAFT_382852 [Clohesyomyces aquaticus]|uniref:Uncharacterized protein n=1 Tax=Clohesyomyces aquaticus TaxID=1231657 RepID=A0A1Y1ZFX2_9PLEO|nr:hypothetical protein BCR34DRAFT_382852 [Clohesyomyces aquaticus]